MQEFRPIDSVEALQERMTIMRRAQREFAKFTQEQVDHIFFEAAMAAKRRLRKPCSGWREKTVPSVS